MADIQQIIIDAAQRNGVDPQALLGVLWIESRFDPNAKNPHSTAAGLGQFTAATARHYGLADPFDPYQNADASARFMRDNAAYLGRRLGRAPTPGELYLAHQQGAGGALKLLANPGAPVEQVVGAEAARLNGAQPGMTAGQFAARWSGRLDGTHPPLTESALMRQGVDPGLARAAAERPAGDTPPFPPPAPRPLPQASGKGFGPDYRVELGTDGLLKFLTS